MLISPMAHVALLQTDMNSGFRFWPNMGRKSAMLGRTCWKHALVKSPSSANDDCRTSKKEKDWVSSAKCRRLSYVYNFEIPPALGPACTGTAAASGWSWAPDALCDRPGLRLGHWASPKRLSWSLCRAPRTVLDSDCSPGSTVTKYQKMFFWLLMLKNKFQILTMCWLRVCSISETHRLNTGSQ